MDFYIRLVTSCLIEYSKDWSSGRLYINPQIVTKFWQVQQLAFE